MKMIVFAVVAALQFYCVTASAQYTEEVVSTDFKRLLVTIKAGEVGKNPLFFRTISYFDPNQIFSDFLEDFSEASLKRTSVADLTSMFAINPIDEHRGFYGIGVPNGVLSGERVNQQVNAVYYKGHFFPSHYFFANQLHEYHGLSSFKGTMQRQPWIERVKTGRKIEYVIRNPESEESKRSSVKSASQKILELLKQDYGDTLSLWRGTFAGEAILFEIIHTLLQGQLPKQSLIDEVTAAIKKDIYYRIANRKNRAFIRLLKSINVDHPLTPKELGEKVLKNYTRLTGPLYFADQREEANAEFAKGALLEVKLSHSVLEKLLQQGKIALGVEVEGGLSLGYVEVIFSRESFKVLFESLTSPPRTYIGDEYQPDPDILYSPEGNDLWEITKFQQPNSRSCVELVNQ